MVRRLMFRKLCLKFFNIIDKDTIELKLDDENYKEISFIKEDLPLEFSLQRKRIN